MSDSRQIAKQIHKWWSFIPEEDAENYCKTLFGTPIDLAQILISLWVLKKVLEYNDIK